MRAVRRGDETHDGGGSADAVQRLRVLASSPSGIGSAATARRGAGCAPLPAPRRERALPDDGDGQHDAREQHGVATGNMMSTSSSAAHGGSLVRRRYRAATIELRSSQGVASRPAARCADASGHREFPGARCSPRRPTRAATPSVSICKPVGRHLHGQLLRRARRATPPPPAVRSRPRKFGRRFPHGPARGAEQVEEMPMLALGLIEQRTGFRPHPGFSAVVFIEDQCGRPQSSSRAGRRQQVSCSSPALRS